MVKAEYIKPSYSGIPGPFSDPRVILVREDDARAYLRPGYTCNAFQGLDTPTYVTIGKNASDTALAEVHARYGVPLADLREFRAMQSSSSEY